MTPKYIIFKFRLQRYDGERKEIMPAEECAKMIGAMLPKPGEKDGLNLVETKGRAKKKGMFKHGNYMENFHRQIASLLIEANKTKKITNDYIDRWEEDNPYLRVLFDLRPEHCFMAIERKASAMKVADAVCLIKDAVNAKLGESRWTFECQQPTIPMNFWDVLVFIRRKFNDHLRKVSLLFDDTQATDKEEEKKRLRVIDDFISHFSKGSFSIDMDDEERMERYKDDILHLGVLCAERNYQLSAEFRYFGQIFYAQDFPAIMPLDKKHIEDFTDRRGETDIPGYSIESWFEHIHDLFDCHEELNDDERRRSKSDKI